MMPHPQEGEVTVKAWVYHLRLEKTAHLLPLAATVLPLQRSVPVSSSLRGDCGFRAGAGIYGRGRTTEVTEAQSKKEEGKRSKVATFSSVTTLSSSPCLRDLRGSFPFEFDQRDQLSCFPSGTVTGLCRGMPDRKSPRLGQRVGRLRSTSVMAMSPHSLPVATGWPAWS